MAEAGGRKEEHDVLLVLPEDWAAPGGEGHVSKKTQNITKQHMGKQNYFEKHFGSEMKPLEQHLFNCIKQNITKPHMVKQNYFEKIFWQRNETS